MRQAARLAWRALAVLALVLAALGAVLPVLPTVPFLILAAWAGGKGWPALEHWLLNHAHLGPGIRRWRERGAVPRRAKWLATVMMTGSAVMLALSPAPMAVKIGVPAVMAGVAIWLWRRPEA
ncbi:YbaN family protein [Roseateles sp.]|uniref:YbaN family protein n=1 Tax=Roseateles sp. TaxID=1971397 RepID=UPI003BAB865A